MEWTSKQNWVKREKERERESITEKDVICLLMLHVFFLLFMLNNELLQWLLVVCVCVTVNLQAASSCEFDLRWHGSVKCVREKAIVFVFFVRHANYS